MSTSSATNGEGLIQRLREWAATPDYHTTTDEPNALCREAADWIEKLERENLNLQHDIERSMKNHNADIAQVLPLEPQETVTTVTPATGTKYMMPGPWAPLESTPSASGWIKAEDRKPAFHQEVMIYHVLGDRDRPEVPHGFDVAWWTKEGWLFPWDRGDRQRPMFVTHWKPLPEKP